MGSSTNEYDPEKTEKILLNAFVKNFPSHPNVYITPNCRRNRRPAFQIVDNWLDITVKDVLVSNHQFKQPDSSSVSE